MNYTFILIVVAIIALWLLYKHSLVGGVLGFFKPLASVFSGGSSGGLFGLSTPALGVTTAIL